MSDDNDRNANGRASSSSSSSCDSESTSSSSSSSSVDRSVNAVATKDQQTLTAAEIMRRQRTDRQASTTGCDLILDRKQQQSASNDDDDDDKSKNSSSVGSAHPSADLDEEIRRLEAELQNEESGDSDGSDSDSSDSEDEKKKKEAAILSLSASKSARIEGLPPSCLPASRKRVLKGIDSGADRTKTKKRKIEVGEAQVSEGLKSAVQEILQGYKPRSAERLPLYCRVCAKQFETKDDFVQHKNTDFHKTAYAMERKASYCKLCRKQLTSPAQLQEHLQSKPHKQRLQSMQSRQQQRHHNPQRRRQQGGRQWS